MASCNALMTGQIRKTKLAGVTSVEKAAAKVYGGYELLSGGHVRSALALLTGWPCGDHSLDPHDREGGSVEDKRDVLWLTLLSLVEARAVCCASARTDAALGVCDATPRSLSTRRCASAEAESFLEKCSSSFSTGRSCGSCARVAPATRTPSEAQCEQR